MPPRPLRIAALVACVAGPLAAAAAAHRQAGGRAIYVDPSIRPASCTTYAPTSRTCGDGDATAYRALDGAARAATPGTTVMLRAGTYTDPLVPPASGTEPSPIVFQAADGEAATLSAIDGPALQIIGRSYVTVANLTVDDVAGWGRVQDSTHIVIRGMRFRNATASGTTGGLKFVRSSFNRITGNRFEEGTDNLLLQDASNGNLVSGNTFTGAHHSLLSIRCAEANAIRGNLFDNPRQKAIELYDCEGVSDAPVRYDATRRNVIENNSFVRTRAAGRAYEYNAIQHGAQYTLVRRNVFRGALGGGVNYQSYPQESLFVHSNRLYQNTFYANRCFALVGNRGDGKQYFDNVAVDNLFYLNADCEGGGTQISIDDRSAVVLRANAVETRDPGFVDPKAGNFRLVAGSAEIDAASPLTTTTSDGQGTSLPVADVLFFYAGRAVPGDRGDEIQLLGTTDRARIVAIDASARRLMLDRPVAWHSGQGVALAFNGAAPDFGAFEAEPPRRASAARCLLQRLGGPAGWWASADGRIVR